MTGALAPGKLPSRLRVPAAEDFDLLPDMGRMTSRLQWAEATGYWPGACAPGNVPQP